MDDNNTINYAFALKNYKQNNHGRSMKRFLEVEGGAGGGVGIAEVRVRFTNGMELLQGEGDIRELLDMVRKMIG